MKKTKERGSIVILVLSSLLIITSFVIISFNKVNNKILVNKEDTQKIQEEYNGNSENIEEQMKEEYEMYEMNV